MKKAVKIVIAGTVQGVFFRQFVKDEADKLALRGMVRNLENGDVEVFAEGNLDNVNKFIEICKQGPKHARIRNVVVEERRFSGDFPDFKILRF
jgi:acylphosphatase